MLLYMINYLSLRGIKKIGGILRKEAFILTNVTISTK